MPNLKRSFSIASLAICTLVGGTASAESGSETKDDACYLLLSQSAQAKARELKVPGSADTKLEAKLFEPLREALAANLPSGPVGDKVIVVDVRLCRQGSFDPQDFSGCSLWFGLLNSGLEKHVPGEGQQELAETRGNGHFVGAKFSSFVDGVAPPGSGPIVEVQCWSYER